MNKRRVRTASAIAAGASIAGLGLAACHSNSSGGTTTGSAASVISKLAGGGATAAGDTGGGGSTDVDVCSLLSAAQASSIVGVTYSGTQSSHDMCNYIPGADAPSGMFVIVSTTADQSWTQALSILQEDGGASPSPVSGVGDKAAGSGTQFDVLHGKWIIDVHGGDPTGQSGDFTHSAAIAKVIIAELH